VVHRVRGPRLRRHRGALSRTPARIAGIVAGGLALAVGAAVAAITQVVSPIDAVGSEVIDRAPRWLKELAISWFGTADKTALRIGIVAILAVVAAAVGPHTRPARVAFIGLGVLGAVASVHRPNETFGAALPSLLGAAVGYAVLQRWLRPRPIEVPGPSQAPLGWDRRRFITNTATATAVATVAGVAARRASAPAPVPAIDLASDVTVPAEATVSPFTPFITPNDRYYRIDTALSFPRVDIGNWKCTIDGLVDRPFSFTYDDLLAMPRVERIITLCCVSNEVGGEYIGNAVWQGVSLRDLLDRAGVQSSAEQVFSTSLDGWTSGFPVDAAVDGRDALVAFGMNGAPLPLEHGYPARLVVPGLYGYVSATKWLSRIELTTWDREGYWVPRGWSQQAPVKTQSRIDVPRDGQSLTAGRQAIAGIAWAQHRGIDAVEVSIDGGPWSPARMALDVSDDAWRQWVFDWTATSGSHTIAVRATDKTGTTQPAERTAVAPDGATGHHTISVTVR
jgi:DMSO/TMAO reductase YedYZ molybdopterin-dependent catalytic subunit